MISVKNLSKYYGPVKAVDDISFEVGRGEIVGLLGHNGAGKTTLMKMITGFLEPSSGKVTVGGADVLTDRLSVQKQIGYMPENAPLYEEMFVQEYLLTMADYRGIPKEKQKEIIVAAAKSTGLTKWLTRPISTLSKGYRQRTGLAGAILHKPDLLILDEPTNGLDPTQIVEIRELIKQLSKDSTVILSTHILPEIEAVCDRVIILIDGELAKDAPLSELLSSKKVTLSVARDARDIEKKIAAIDGVSTARRSGADPKHKGFDIWSVEYKGDSAPIPEIVELIKQSDWRLAHIAEETPHLEQVFGNLMDAHIARSRSGKGKEAAA